MTLQALAVFLVSWVVHDRSPQDTWDDLHRWERHPVEQKHLREQAAHRANLLHQYPRTW